MTATTPTPQRWTLTRHLIEERRRFPQASGDLNALLLDISLACKAIARIVAFGRLADRCGLADTEAARARLEDMNGRGVNVHGEVQKPLDLISNDIFLHMNEWNGQLAGMASEEMPDPRPVPHTYTRGK